MRHIATALVLASVALSGSVPLATASSSDEQATHAYLLAHQRLVTALLRDTIAARGPEGTAAAQIARECPGVVSGMPHEPPLDPFPALPPLARGENARLSEQKQTIEEELGAAVSRAGNSVFRPAHEAYDAEVLPLAWSNPAIASEVRTDATSGLEASFAPAPPFCADARAWAQSGYRTLSAASREFQTSQTVQRNSGRVEAGSLSALLKPFENRPDLALMRKTEALEFKVLASFAPSVGALRNLDRVVGFAQPRIKEAKPVTLGRGRTAAGTRFEVSTGAGLAAALAGTCHHSATVAYSRPGAPEELIVGGPNNPICVSSPRYRHPALFCEVGIETVQGAAPASVSSVRLVLADRRTIQSRVVRVPRRDGGPAGIYAQEIRGSTSHALSLLELDGGGGVVLTIELPRYRCVKPRGEQEGPPRITNLASGSTAGGEAFTISAFGSFNDEPFLSVDTGVDPELSEASDEFDTTKTYTWSLRIGCAPHPYAILYAILLPREARWWHKPPKVPSR